MPSWISHHNVSASAFKCYIKSGIAGMKLIFGAAFILFTLVIIIYNTITTKLQILIEQKSDDEKSIQFARKLPLVVTALFLSPLLTEICL
jgi:hypothetical protein